MGCNKGFVIGVGVFLTLHLATAVSQEVSGTKFGLLEIGGSLSKVINQLKSDCNRADAGNADCKGVDSVGRVYSFYQGKLIRLSLSAQSGERRTKLPAGLVFGEEIDLSANKLRKALKIRLAQGTSDTGSVAFASGFDVKASCGWHYSIEIIADAQGNLLEIVERANIP